VHGRGKFLYIGFYLPRFGGPNCGGSNSGGASERRIKKLPDTVTAADYGRCQDGPG
jgi:hypothetical protein